GPALRLAEGRPVRRPHLGLARARQRRRGGDPLLGAGHAGHAGPRALPRAGLPRARRPPAGHRGVRGLAPMRLVVFDDSRLGLLRDDRVVDVSDLAGAGAGEWPPVFLLRAIAGFDGLRPRLEEALRSRAGVPLAGVALRAPVVFPSKVIAAPVNYRAHIEEMRPLIKGELHAIEKY